MKGLIIFRVVQTCTRYEIERYFSYRGVFYRKMCSCGKALFDIGRFHCITNWAFFLLVDNHTQTFFSLCNTNVSMIACSLSMKSAIRNVLSIDFKPQIVISDRVLIKVMKCV
jgi:hypothetical protein